MLILGSPVGEGAGALCLQAWDHCLTRHSAEGGAGLGRHCGIGRLEGQGHERVSSTQRAGQPRSSARRLQHL